MSRKHAQIETAAGCFDELLAAARRARTRLSARTFEKGECLMRQGEPLSGLLLLSRGLGGGAGGLAHRAGPLSGLLLLSSGLGRVSTSSANGREILHAFVGPGEVIGELEYFAGEPISCTVEAARRTEAWFLSPGAVDALLAREPRLAIALATTLARRFHGTVVRSSERIAY